MNTQINHQWEEKIVIPHLHWFQNQDEVPNWLVQYRWQVNGESKETDWTNQARQSAIFTYVSGVICQICNFGIINAPSNVNASSILQLRLVRDTENASGLFSGADPYTGDAGALNYDIHKHCNRLGTTGEYA